MTKVKLSTWLRSGVIEENLKETLEATLCELKNACPLYKVSNNSIRNSLYDILSNDKVFREESTARTTVFNWLSKKSPYSCKKKQAFAVFKKNTRFYTSTIAVGPHATANNYNSNVAEAQETSNEYNSNVIEPSNGDNSNVIAQETANGDNSNVIEPQETANRDNNNIIGPQETSNEDKNNNVKTRVSSPPMVKQKTCVSSPPPVNQTFSFANDEQGAIVEPFINCVEKALRKFIIDNKHIIPSKIVESFVAKQHHRISPDFENADVLCMIKFINENISIFLNKSVFHGRYKADPTELLSSFKKNVRDKMAHGTIIDEKGRWSDLALQNVAHLACEIVACLGK
jgi:hypothetical protein